MSFLTSPIAPTTTAASLHRRFLLWAALGGIVVILLLAAGANSFLRQTVETRGDITLGEAAHRASLVLGSALEERQRASAVLAMMPEVESAARQGGARAAALALPSQPIAEVEKRFADTHSMQLAPDTRLLLRRQLPRFEARDALLTDANGYNALITERSGDFVQSDEGWWQDAWRNGTSISDAAFDSVSRSSVVAVSSVIRSGDTKLGVLKVKFDVTPLVVSLASAGAGLRIDVVDSTGRVLIGSDESAMGSSLGAMAGIDSLHAADVAIAGQTERAVARPVAGTRWRVVAHVPAATLAAPYRTAKLAIVASAIALVAVLIVLLLVMHRFLERRISGPVRALADVAEAVAAGDFGVDVIRSSADDEIGRLNRATGGMIVELRRLAQTIAGAARETNAMSSDITAGSEEMAATAGEIASTASDLSSQATVMAETIGGLAGSASALRELAAQLDSGALEGLERNATLRTLAANNRAGLDASAQSLTSLGQDVHASAMAIEGLAEASAEIRSFVSLVRKLARQSKLLALNAAMEAARAGAQGEGFAVVASEVRRLASMSADAAERTEQVVNGVLGGIDRSRESAGRAVAMTTEVHTSTAVASESFSEIERAVAEAEAWTASVKETSAATNDLVLRMTSQLEQLAGGTESFAAAMEQVAASSEEQSAATQEIAGAASTLVSAAQRLDRIVAGLRIGGSAGAEALQAGLSEDVAPSAPELAHEALDGRAVGRLEMETRQERQPELVPG